MASNVVYVLHFIYFILRFMNVTIRSDSVDNESTAVPQSLNKIKMAGDMCILFMKM